MRLLSAQKPALAAAALLLGALAAGGARAQAQFNPAYDGTPRDTPHIGLYPQEGIISSGIASNLPLGPTSNKGRCPGAPASGTGQPQVVSTFPAEGAVVRPGIVVVRVTFDRPMSCDASFDGTGGLPNPCPGRWREVTISSDHRSLRTICEVEPNARYELHLRSFRSTDNVMAAPRKVVFSTSGAGRVGTVQQALAEDPAGKTVAGG